MNVGELKAKLEGWEDSVLIVLAKDEEGNSHSPLAYASVGMYSPESTWSGEFHEAETIGNDEYEQPGEEAVTAICLWPIN